MDVYEVKFRRQGFCVIGVDEAGRGSWAGPVAAAAVSLPLVPLDCLIRDSKVLSKKQREISMREIVKKAFWGVGFVSARKIDAWGIVRATQKAMENAVADLMKRFGKKISQSPYVLIDGYMRLDLPYSMQSMIHGESKSVSIASASIIAKVKRDALMERYHAAYPSYRFDLHRGYGTEKHQKALAQHGPCAIHRRSYAPVKKFFHENA